jgi:hypothetical protein
MAIAVLLDTEHHPEIQATAPSVSHQPPPGCPGSGWLLLRSALAEEVDDFGAASLHG